MDGKERGISSGSNKNPRELPPFFLHLRCLCWKFFSLEFPFFLPRASFSCLLQKCYRSIKTQDPGNKIPGLKQFQAVCREQRPHPPGRQKDKDLGWEFTWDFEFLPIWCWFQVGKALGMILGFNLEFGESKAQLLNQTQASAGLGFISKSIPWREGN